MFKSQGGLWHNCVILWHKRFLGKVTYLSHMAVNNSNLYDIDYNAKDKISGTVLFQDLLGNL